MTLTIDYNALKRDNWNANEVENVKLIIDFVQNIMNYHNFDYVLDKFDNDQYVQHNRSIPQTSPTSGVKDLVGFLRKFTKNFPDYTYDVKSILVDNDVVIFHSHVTTNSKHRGNEGKGFNIIDKWRVAKDVSGKKIIVDHWDAVQALDFFMRFYMLLTGGSIKNKNSIF